MKLLIAIAALALGAVATAAQSEDLERYLKASRVPVRATASATAPIQAYLVANDKLRLVANQGEWCEIQTSATVHGYCLCQYLANAPMSIAEIQAQLAKPKMSARERLDWESRAFWVEPSLPRWIAVGKLMSEALLSPEIRQKELEGAKPLRFKTPEFEAMKQRLAQGISDPKAGSVMATISMKDEPLLKKALTHLALPKIGVSYLTKGDVFVWGNAGSTPESDSSEIALVQALSSYDKLAYRTTMEGGAAFNQQFGVVKGLWDVGAINVKFDQPARIFGITSRGQLTTSDVSNVKITVGQEDITPCYSTTMDVSMKDVHSMPPWNESLLGWVGKPAIDKKAVVRQRQFVGKDAEDKLVVSDIDLDGDGIPDFSVWDGHYKQEAGGSDRWGAWQAIFVNIDGKWQFVKYDQDNDCT